MSKNFIIGVTATLLVALGTIGCKQDNKPKDGIEITDSDAILETTTKQTSINYRLPSPVELYVFLREEEARFNKDALNSVDSLPNYVTTKAKALNFGVYASDLAYCTVFAKPQQTFFYFKAAKKLAEELGLAEGFDDAIMKRLENSLNNTDSLFNITSDAYFEACQHLEVEDKTDILGYIIVGGWLESVSIAFNSVEKFDVNNGLIIRIAEQQLLLENLINNLKLAAVKTPSVNEVLTDMNKLKAAYDKLYDNTDEAPITEAQYNEIKTTVSQIRKKIIG